MTMTTQLLAQDTYKNVTELNHLIVLKMYRMVKKIFSRSFLKNNLWIIIEFQKI